MPDDEFFLRDFSHHASAREGGISRRQFLEFMAASLAVAGLGACANPPREKIVPYAHKPEEIVPGKPLFFATTMPLSGYATGLLAESHEGRPTKVEGNPSHPGSLGATDAFAQASVLALYDPDRSQALTYQGRIRTWEEFLHQAQATLDEQRAQGGAGLRVLSEAVSSPTLADQYSRMLNLFPQARWHQYEPINRDNARAGALLAFGEYVEARYRFENADVILALDSDCLSCGPGSLRYVREFIAHRRMRAGQTAMNRLYVVESTPSLTGAIADHRLPLRASEIESFARSIAAGVGGEVGGNIPLPESAPGNWLEALVRDLLAHHGASLIAAGDGQPPAVHALAHAMNAALGNVGRTVVYTDPVTASPVDQTASLHELAQDMEAGLVEVLLILGGNPAYTALADIPFAEQLAKVKLSIHLSLYEDETSALCQWHIPETHYLEMWGDARAFDGTASHIQPLIAPLYGGHSTHELLAIFNGQPERSGYDIVRAYWQGQHPGDDFEHFWRTALHDGFIPGTALPEKL